MPITSETRRRFEQEEQAYRHQRDELLQRYKGKWVAIVGGQVAAVGESSGDVIREAYRKTGSKVGYAAQVGREDVVYRIRQVVAGRYDHAYQPAIPRVGASVRHLTDAASIDVDFIVDTGADLTVLRHEVADAIGLWDSAWRTATIAGVSSPPESRPLYAGTVHLAHHNVPVEVGCRDDLNEDILGRDVINEFALTVCAKRDQVELAWVDEPPGA